MKQALKHQYFTAAAVQTRACECARCGEHTEFHGGLRCASDTHFYCDACFGKHIEECWRRMVDGSVDGPGICWPCVCGTQIPESAVHAHLPPSAWDKLAAARQVFVWRACPQCDCLVSDLFVFGVVAGSGRYTGPSPGGQADPGVGESDAKDSRRVEVGGGEERRSHRCRGT